MTCLLPILFTQISHIHGLQVAVQAQSHRIDQLSHIEHGSVHCDDSPSWQDSTREPGGTVVRKNVTHTFSRPYLQAPVVQYGVDTFDHCVVHTAGCQRHDVELLEVTKSGFTIRCGTWGSPYDVRHLMITWTSFAQ